jgi:hypothetical protein
MLNRSGDIGHPCLELDILENRICRLSAVAQAC